MKIGIRIATLLALAIASFTNAFADAPEFDAYFDANSKFNQMVTASATNTPPTMPRVVSPTAAALIAIMSDSERFLVKPQFGVEHMGILMDVCNNANQTVMAYMLFDLKNRVDINATSTTIARQVSVAMNRNAHMFQTELESLHPFLVRCLAQEIPLMTQLMSALKPEELTDTRRAGLRQARIGILGAILGAIQASSDKSLTESYRAAVLHAIADNSLLFASALTVADRQQLLTGLASTQKSVPSEASGHLQKIVEAMSDNNCTGLCIY